MKLKKKDGSVDKMGIVLLALVAMFIAIIMSLNASGDMEKRSKVDGVAAHYTKFIEANGFLSDAAEREMIKELEMIGVKNISTIGSTKVVGGYGKDVFLKFRGTIEITTYEFKNLFSIKEVKTPMKIDIEKKSVGKY